MDQLHQFFRHAIAAGRDPALWDAPELTDREIAETRWDRRAPFVCGCRTYRAGNEHVLRTPSFDLITGLIPAAPCRLTIRPATTLTETLIDTREWAPGDGPVPPLPRGVLLPGNLIFTEVCVETIPAVPIKIVGGVCNSEIIRLLYVFAFRVSFGLCQVGGMLDPPWYDTLGPMNLYDGTAAAPAWLALPAARRIQRWWRRARHRRKMASTFAAIRAIPGGVDAEAARKHFETCLAEPGTVH